MKLVSTSHCRESGFLRAADRVDFDDWNLIQTVNIDKLGVVQLQH